MVNAESRHCKVFENGRLLFIHYPSGALGGIKRTISMLEQHTLTPEDEIAYRDLLKSDLFDEAIDQDHDTSLGHKGRTYEIKWSEQQSC